MATAPHPEWMTVDAAGLTEFTRTALEVAGLNAADAARGADVLARTTVRGVESHGVWFLNRYVRQLRQGGASGRAAPETVADRDAVLVLDGSAGLGPAVAARATETVLERARAHGVAVVAVRNANHFGAAGHYALMCAEAGCVGLVTCNTPPIMAVTGSRNRSIGNNPLAFGAPRADGPPVVLDIAMSRVAGGKVRMALDQGEQVPPGWILGPEGEPTTDPADFLQRRGALLPMEGHKGYGLALMVETLAAAVPGAAMAGAVGNWLYTPDEPSGTGFFLLALDVRAGGPLGDVGERVRALCAEVAAAPRAPSVERILVPGEPEHEHELHARAHGLALRSEVWAALQEVAAELGLEERLAAIRR